MSSPMASRNFSVIGQSLKLTTVPFLLADFGVYRESVVVVGQGVVMACLLVNYPPEYELNLSSGKLCPWASIGALCT